MYRKDKRKLLSLRLSDSDFAFLVNQSKNLNWSVSRYLRYLIRAECAIVDFSNELNKENKDDKQTTKHYQL